MRNVPPASQIMSSAKEGLDVVVSVTVLMVAQFSPHPHPPRKRERELLPPLRSGAGLGWGGHRRLLPLHARTRLALRHHRRDDLVDAEARGLRARRELLEALDPL